MLRYGQHGELAPPEYLKTLFSEKPVPVMGAQTCVQKRGGITRRYFG